LSKIILDSSLLLASVLPQEPLQAQAKRALLHWTDAGIRLAVPSFFRSEVVAVVRKAVFQKRITHEYGKLLLPTLLQADIEFYEDDELLMVAYEIAARFNMPRIYDAQYLILAERLNCDFWTADATLVNTIQGQFSHIHWLGSITPPQAL
jgi:predicted nucleic acid-binding protein